LQDTKIEVPEHLVSWSLVRTIRKYYPEKQVRYRLWQFRDGALDDLESYMDDRTFWVPVIAAVEYRHAGALKEGMGAWRILKGLCSERELAIPRVREKVEKFENLNKNNLWGRELIFPKSPEAATNEQNAYRWEQYIRENYPTVGCWWDQVEEMNRDPR